MADRAHVSYLPVRHGDCCSFGGETVLTIDGLTLIIGNGDKAQNLAEEIAAAINGTPYIAPEEAPF